jgi:DME family drug/metabolite transporter
MRLKGFFYVTCAGFMWGFIGPFSKVAFQEGVSPLEVAFWRAVLAWIFFGLHAAATGQVKLNVRDIPAVIAFGVTGIAGLFGSYTLAVDEGGAALASVLLYTAPAWVAVLSAIFFKEVMTVLKLIALGLTMVGVVGVCTDSAGLGAYIQSGVGGAAVGFGLLSGFFYSLYYVFGKHFSTRYSSPNLFLYILPIGALCIFAMVDFGHKTVTAWLAMVGLAVVSTYGPYYCYYVGLKYLEPSRAAITATLEPVVATIAAYIWWGESFAVNGYAGSVLILTAVSLMVWEGARLRGNTVLKPPAEET